MALNELGERLALIIDAKTDGAVSSIRRLSAEEKAAGEQADVLRAKIADLEGRAAKAPLSKTAGLQLTRARSELSGIESTLATGVTPGATKAEQALSKLGLAGTVSGEAIVGGLTTAGAAAVAFGGFEFLKTGVEDYIDLASAVRQFQQASGASAEDASKLVGISQALGVSSSAAALGVFRLGKQVALAPQNFTDLGIAIAKNNDGSTDLVGTLENVATAYQHNGDAAQRNAIVYQAFGRAGTTLLPILNASKSSIEELVAAEAKRGHIFDQSEIDQAYKYQIATRELQDSFHALAIEAAKTLVPAITNVETGLTKISDFSHNSTISKGLGFIFDETPFGIGKNLLTGNFKGAIPVVGPFLDLFGHHSSSGDTAQQKAAAEQAQAQVQQIEQQVLATLAGPFDKLAGKTAIHNAKQTLDGALQSVSDAKREQAAALRALEKARQGSPVATESSLSAAEARVQAAEAGYRKAQYVGGDAGLTSAHASVLSAQASLNRLRQQGGTDTNTLANAEDRLKRANEAVATAQKKASAAQRAENQSHGLSTADVLKRITAQANNQGILAKANAKLAREGLTSPVIEQIDALEQQMPGTLKRVADTMTLGLARQLDHQEDKLNLAHIVFQDAAGHASDYYKAGRAARESFNAGFLHDGVKGLLTQSIPGTGAQSRVRAPHLGPGGITGLIVNGGLHVKADTGSELQRKANRAARRKALSGGLRGPR